MIEGQQCAAQENEQKGKTAFFLFLARDNKPFLPSTASLRSHTELSKVQHSRGGGTKAKKGRGEIGLKLAVSSINTVVDLVVDATYC